MAAEDIKVVIRRNVHIDVDGLPPWKVPADLICKIDNEEFITLHPSNAGFSRILSGHRGDKNVSVCQSKGIDALRNARNARQKELFEPKPESSGLAAVFGVANVPQKRRRINNSEAKDLRDNLVAMTLRLPGCETDVVLARPVHPSDAFIVKLDGDSVANIINFVRRVDQGIVPLKRVYTTRNVGDTWRMGNGRVATRAVDGVRKFRYMKQESQEAGEHADGDVPGEHVPREDGNDSDNVGPDHDEP